MQQNITYMASNEKTKLTSRLHKNYSSKSHHLYDRTISRVLWLAFVVAMPCLAPGMSFGYSAIVLDQLPLTVDEQSWFASLPSTMMPIGCLLSGPMIDKLGRKTALIATNVPSFLGWTLLSMPHTSLYVLYTGQLLVGLSVGLSTTPAAVYAAECITVNFTRLRGCFTIMTSIVLNFGMLLTYVLGTLMPAYVVAYVAALLSVAAPIFIALLIPESPPWLFEQGRRGDAECSQKVLRIAQPVLQQQKPADPPSLPVDSTRCGHPIAAQQQQSACTGRGVFDRLREPDVLKPMAIMTAFMFFQQFSGSFVLTAYMIQLLGAVDVDVRYAYPIAVVAGLTNLGAMVLLSVLLTRCSFKQLSLISCAGYSASMAALAALLCLRQLATAHRDPYYSAVTGAAVVACVLLNMATNGLGLRPVPYAMLGEVFPIDVAGVAGSIVACLSSVFNFAAIKAYPYLLLWIGPGTYALYGTVATCACVFVVKYVPDTKGKTIKQIGDGFRQRSDTDVIVVA